MFSQEHADRCPGTLGIDGAVDADDLLSFQGVPRFSTAANLSFYVSIALFSKFQTRQAEEKRR